MKPLVTVVTPCMPERYELLLSRCLPSLEDQTSTAWRLLLVADHSEGDRLRRLAPSDAEVVEAPPCDWQDAAAFHFAAGCAAAGKPPYVAYLCDDDEWRPHHLETHLALLESSPEIDFSWSRVEFRLGGERKFEVGSPTFALGNLDSSGIVHRRRLLEVSSWQDTPNWDSDFRMLERWHRAGACGQFIPELTAVHHDGWLARQPGGLAA